LGFRVKGLGFRVQVLGIRGSRLMIYDSGGWGLGFALQGLLIVVYGLGFRV
jgi:hypothetical protein